MELLPWVTGTTHTVPTRALYPISRPNPHGEAIHLVRSPFALSYTGRREGVIMPSSAPTGHVRDICSSFETNNVSTNDGRVFAALARTRECRQDCVRFAYRGPQVDRLHVLELKRDVE